MKDILNFTMIPLGRINDSVAFCHHGGWYECDLETHQLCAGSMSPSNPWAMHDFAACSFNNFGSNDADNTRLCATNSSLDYKALWQCATGTARETLLQGIEYATSLGIHSAPSILLNGQNVGNTLSLQQICAAYTGPKPAGCSSASVAAPPSQVVPCVV